jgi:peptidoglycan-associated lipoprotein
MARRLRSLRLPNLIEDGHMLRRSLTGFGTLALLAGCGHKAAPEPPATPASAPAPASNAMPSGSPDGSRAIDAERARAAAVIAEPVYFEFDQARLTPSAKATLEAKAAILRRDGLIRVAISGHADERGSDEYNLALGMRRATAVQQYLRQLGIAGDRLETASYGEERPAVRGHDERAYAANRRAEFASGQLQMSSQ